MRRRRTIFASLGCMNVPIQEVKTEIPVDSRFPYAISTGSVFLTAYQFLKQE
jgi:hypothetical protein